MKMIRAYVINVLREQDLALPRGSTILSVHTQGSDTCLYVMADPHERSTESRWIECWNADCELERPDELRFIGTVGVRGLAVACHFFERVRVALVMSQVVHPIPDIMAEGAGEAGPVGRMESLVAQERAAAFEKGVLAERGRWQRLLVELAETVSSGTPTSEALTELAASVDRRR